MNTVILIILLVLFVILFDIYSDAIEKNKLTLQTFLELVLFILVVLIIFFAIRSTIDIAVGGSIL